MAKKKNYLFPWTPQPQPRSVTLADIDPDFDAHSLMETSAILNQGAAYLRRLEENGQLYDSEYLDRLRHYEAFLYEAAAVINDTLIRREVKQHWPFFVPEKPKSRKRSKKQASPEEAAARRAMTLKLRFSVLEKANFRCTYCGRTSDDIALEVDHVHPVSAGGLTVEENLVAACWECNAGKSNRVGIEASS